MARLNDIKIRVDSRKARDEIGELAEGLKGHDVSDEAITIIKDWVKSLCVVESVPPKGDR